MIKNFIKKPTQVQAVQWTGYNFDEIAEIAGKDNFHIFGNFENPELFILTSEGYCPVNMDNWIVCGANGKLHLYDPYIFEKMYMEV